MLRIYLLLCLLLVGCGLFDDDAPRITQFDVSPNPVDRGGTITLAWATENTAYVEIRVALADYNFGDAWMRPDRATVARLPATGRWAYLVPVDAQRTPRFFIDAVSNDGRRTALTSDVVAFKGYACIHTDAICATAPTSTAITVQERERATLLWWNNRVYVLSTAVPGWQAYAAQSLTDLPPDVMPGAALHAPITYTADVQQYIDNEAMFDYFIVDWHGGGYLLVNGRMGEVQGPAWQLHPAADGLTNP